MQATTLLQLPIRDKIRFTNSLLLALLLSLLFTRGLFEMVLGKKVAIILQFGGVLSFFILYFCRGQCRINSTTLILILLFLGEALFSCLNTTLLHENTDWIYYMAFNIGLMGIALLTLRKVGEVEGNVSIVPTVALLGCLMVAVALLEQLKLVNLPGESFVYLVRPASTTGSFLHYPLVMSILGFICLHGRYYLSATLFLLIPFVTVSRSGLLVVLAALTLYPFLNRFRNAGRVIFLLLALGVTMAALLFSGLDDRGSLFSKMAYRLTTVMSSNALGNSGRIESWKRSLADWTDTNLLIGEESGKVTNATSNMQSHRKNDSLNPRIAESSVLQLLSNFGLLGLLLFYAILFQGYRLIEPEAVWLKACFLGALAQTAVYQSIEVVPFITLLLLIPFISQTLKFSNN